MVNDNLNIIVTEGEGGLLNGDFKLDRIEVNNEKTFEKIFRTTDKKLNINDVLCILINQFFVFYSLYCPDV